MKTHRPERPKYHRIGQISKMLGIPAYVLRYWETEFPQLNPQKTPTGQRMYSESDIEIIKKIKQLRYDEKITVSGTKARLKTRSPERNTDEIKQILRTVKNGLQEILSDLG